MKYVTRLLCTTLLAFLSFATTSAQVLGDPEKRDASPTIQGVNAEGTRFIVGFMENEESSSVCARRGERNLSQHRIAIASRLATNVTIIYPNGTRIVRVLKPNRINSLILNGEQYECLGDRVCNKSFEIVSDEPVSVYCFSSKPYTSDGYLALPISSWGTEYFTVNAAVDHYPPRSDSADDPDNCRIEPRPGEFAVIAAEDFTTVTVTATTRTRSGTPANVPQQKILMKGEIWQVQAQGNVRGRDDITGSHVVADKPVGLLSGHVRTAMPWSFKTKDHLIEMIPPVEALGTRHIVVPFSGRNGGDIVRVIGARPGRTTITVTTERESVQYSVNDAGSFVEFTVNVSDSAAVIETNQPVLVAHYSQSSDVDPANRFDPYLIITTPEEQFANAAVFQTMPNGRINPIDTTTQFDQHFVTIVSEKENVASLRLNGSSLTRDPRIIAQGRVPSLENDFVWFTIRLPDNRAYVIEGNALFGGYVYGIGKFDSYGWPVGTGFFTETFDTIPPILWAKPECGELIYDIYALDSDTINYNKGLLSLFLDQTRSENVRVVELDPDPLPRDGNLGYRDTARIRVTLIDPTKPGRARIVARDAGGVWNDAREALDHNHDTIEVVLRVIPPTFSRDSILIDKAEINTLRRELITIMNSDGDRPIRIDRAVLVKGVEFKIDGLDRGAPIERSLTPDEEFDLTILFRADKNGAFFDTLVLWVDCLRYRIPLHALVAVPRIETQDLNFGTIRRGTSKCKEICISNTGKAILRIDSIVFRNNDGQVYRFGPDGLPDLPFFLEAGADTCITICFYPDELGTFTGEIEFISNASDGDNRGDLSGHSVYPQINIEGHDFGEVQVGDTACSDTTVFIANTGTDTAFLTGVTIIGEKDIFIADSSIFPYALPPGDTLWVPVCFIPTGEDDYDSFIGAKNNDGLETVGTLLGKGYQLLAKIDGYDWEERRVGTEHRGVVHLRNLKGHEIRIDSLWLEKGGDEDFALLTPIPLSITLGPFQEYALDVMFSPLSAGERSINIFALTSSRVKPVIDSVLEGVGIQPIPEDKLVHDSSLIYSCEGRTSRVVLYNRGRAPLTLDTVWLDIDTTEAIATLNAPSPGSQILVGGAPLEIEINFDSFVGVGETIATVYWTFKDKEFRGKTYSREMKISSEPQRYWISAAAPPQVDNGTEFDLFITVDSSFWKGILHDEVLLKTSYNPRVSLFDKDRWRTLTAGPTSDWTFVGVPEIDSGVVSLRLHPTSGTKLSIDGATFPPIPFRGFLGDQPVDTFRVDMQANTVECVRPTATVLPYSIHEICGLNHRLFYSVGDPPSLSSGKPTPATSSITLEFTVPFEGPALLELYGLNGEKVGTILDETVGAGDHVLTVDLTELPSGIYYYRLRYGDYSATRKLILNR